MPLLVVGSIGLDTVQTPRGHADNVLGGSATYFSYAASFFAPVRLVATVGGDFPPEHRALLEGRRIDTSGLVIQPDRQTFRWRGKYEGDMNAAETVEVHLHVLGDFDPDLPPPFRRSPLVFLANGHPRTQMKVLSQVERPVLTVADTMNFWIETERDGLVELLDRIDGLVLNDGEARMFTERDNLVHAGRAILDQGPQFVIIKKGEHGAMFISRDDIHVMPAYPTPDVVDPTGAGDSFAGGLMGSLAAAGAVTPAALKRGMAYGTVIASLTIEDFSLRRLERTDRAEIDQRFDQYRQMMTF